MFLYIIVGVGGTGSLLARDLPKLLIDTPSRMCIVDGDCVEEKNMKRQSYQKQDVGSKKASALAKKINTFYGNICECICEYITKDELYSYIQRNANYIPVIIGCVDNDKTRMLMESTFKRLSHAIYLDSANSEYDGNVYACMRKDDIQSGALRGESYILSMDVHPADKSCEVQASEGNTQFLVTNALMATTLLEHCDYIKYHRTIKEGVTIVNRFKKLHYE